MRTRPMFLISAFILILMAIQPAAAQNGGNSGPPTSARTAATRDSSASRMAHLSPTPANVHAMPPRAAYLTATMTVTESRIPETIAPLSSTPSRPIRTATASAMPAMKHPMVTLSLASLFPLAAA